MYSVLCVRECEICLSAANLAYCWTDQPSIVCAHVLKDHLWLQWFTMVENPILLIIQFYSISPLTADTSLLLTRSIRDANDQQQLQFGIFVSMRDNVKKIKSYLVLYPKKQTKIFKTLQVSSGWLSGSCSRCFKIFIQDSPSSARHMVDILHISVASVLAV